LEQSCCTLNIATLALMLTKGSRANAIHPSRIASRDHLEEEQ
jgi:hypothetical protein